MVGYVPIESSAVFEEFGDTHIFSGTVGNISMDEDGVALILTLRNNLEIKYTICQVGNISVGGDVLYDNDGAKMYKDEIMQIICKVTLTELNRINTSEMMKQMFKLINHYSSIL